jgi:hypothetical protein
MMKEEKVDGYIAIGSRVVPSELGSRLKQISHLLLEIRSAAMLGARSLVQSRNNVTFLA